jgi:hypothetical protein
VTTAQLFAEAVDTLATLGWALAGWLVFFAAVGSMLVLAAIATGVYGVQSLRRGVAAVLSLAQHSRAPVVPYETASAVHVPSWARDGHDDDIEEAA